MSYITFISLLLLVSIPLKATEWLSEDDLYVQLCTPKDNALFECLSPAPATQQYDRKKISSVVHASRVSKEKFNGCDAHIGYYADSIIVTYITAPKQSFAPGSQVIILNSSPISITPLWENEIVKGIMYVKHIHDTCDVYSTDVSQFVVFH